MCPWELGLTYQHADMPPLYLSASYHNYYRKKFRLVINIILYI
jgi:hypothetical protein